MKKNLLKSALNTKNYTVIAGKRKVTIYEDLDVLKKLLQKQSNKTGIQATIELEGKIIHKTIL